MPHTENVEEFLEKLSRDFYKTVDGEFDGQLMSRTTLKQNSPQRQQNGDVMNDAMTAASQSTSDSSDSSRETFDTLHSHSNYIIGL